MKLKDWKKLHHYCLAKSGAYESRPFGEYPICYRICGKIFCQLTPKEDWFKATLKTDPQAADFYRQAYPNIIVRGYHCPKVQQPHWNTLSLYELELEFVYQMIDEAYDKVVKNLTKKEQKRIPLRNVYRYQDTDGTDEDFAKLCSYLDQDLDRIVLGNENRKQYEQYNRLENIKDVIVIYKEQKAIGSGAFKLYDDETVEIKRIYIEQAHRSLGLGKELLFRLEARARIQGFRFAILETGQQCKEAIGLYQKMGYKVIPNYAQYKDMKESICMQKKL